MGKNNTIIRQWISDEERFASLVNECLFEGKQIFQKEHLKKEDCTQGVLVRTGEGKEISIERYRDILMTADDGTRIVLLACENQDEIHYGMPVRSMLYDAITYTEQIRSIQKLHKEKKELNSAAEFLSGLKKEDLLHPVITIVFYYGEEQWDGNIDLHGLLGLNREEYQFLKEYVPNYKINLINPAEIKDLSKLEESLQKVFGMLRYRKDKIALEKYLEENREYFSNVDNETYQAAKMMMGADKYWKNVKSENGGINMCKALEDLRQECIDIGIEKGIEKGIERGITVFVETLREMGMSYEDILVKIQEKFQLTEEVARQEMERCWK